VTKTEPVPKSALTTPNPLFLRDEELARGIELLDVAHRALFAEPDQRLAALGLSRNHQRVLHYVNRQPGITMARLLEVLQLSKQTVSRLLKDLAAHEMIVRHSDVRDRRRQRLEPTERGRDLDRQLSGRLSRRLADAYRAAGAEAVAGYHAVLLGLVDEPARKRLQSLG